MIYRHFSENTIVDVLIPLAIIDKMISLSYLHLPHEFGGIISGFKVNNHIIAVDAEQPKMFMQSKTGFTRNPGNLNKYLKRIFEKTDGKLDYIGEWHSHPLAKSIYSDQDIQSMREIANDKEIATTSPVLIILSISSSKSSYSMYILQNDNLIHLNKTEII